MVVTLAASLDELLDQMAAKGLIVRGCQFPHGIGKPHIIVEFRNAKPIEVEYAGNDQLQWVCPPRYL